MRYKKVKVVNKARLRGTKDTTIDTCEADGTAITIMDGATVVLSEYALNNLLDATEVLYAHVKDDPAQDMKTSPARLVSTPYHTVDVTELSDWMDSRDSEDDPVKKHKVKKMMDEAKQVKKIKDSDQVVKDRMAKARAARKPKTAEAMA